METREETQPQPRVLVIEDDAFQQDVLREVVNGSGCDCDCASTCAEARALFCEGRYACSLIDLTLPDGNGLSLLREFAQADGALVSTILTADVTAGTVINTMREGAFDYLTKPVKMDVLRAAIARALSHHAVLREKAELFRLLLEEREQLRARVEAATRDLRQYARACELSNARLRALLNLSQLSAGYSTEGALLASTFEELIKHVPLKCLTVWDATRRKLDAVLQEETGEARLASTDGIVPEATYDPLLAEADPELFVQTWVQGHAGFDEKDIGTFVFPDRFRDRATCAVGFMLSPGFECTESDREFLDMCAHFLATEWERGKLLLHVAHEASLGNIAGELVRNFIQPLTAIRTAADFVSEAVVSPDAAEGMEVIHENTERLRRQIQEFRRLSLFRENSVETVRLDEYVDNALDMLSVAIQNRGVTVEKDYEGDSECVLLNGTALARTFLNLILGALRAVEMNGSIALRLRNAPGDHIAFELSYTRVGEAARAGAAASGQKEQLALEPTYQLAERRVHSCGGTLTIDYAPDKCVTVRVLLARNATRPRTTRGERP